MDNIIKTWNDKTIRFRQDDQYGSLTDMAKATGKRVNDWLRQTSVIEYIAELESVTGIPATEIIQVKQGGVPEEQGTWAHRRVCLRFAQWCSPQFAVQVDTWVEELLTTGSVSLSLPQDYLSALKSLVAAEEEKLQLAAKNRILEAQTDFYSNKLVEAEETLTTYRAITSDDSCLTLKQVADALNIKKLGRNNLIKYLREKNFLVQGAPVPYRRAIEAEWAIVVTTTWNDNYGNTRTTQSTRFTFNGLKWLVRSLMKDGYDVQITASQIWDKYNAELVEMVDEFETFDFSDVLAD
jgi:phage antirepressor YoqD-like protein